MTKDILILAVETSCDETSVSVIKNGRDILSNTVLSQIESHKRFGGVVPEVASRHHVEGITTTINEALVDADVSMEDIDAIAVTEGPGLIGALLIGVNAAKTLAFAYDKPLIPVHHIAGHIYANHIEEPLTSPANCTYCFRWTYERLVYMKDHLSFEVIGETRDDAVGEAYDKVARTIGLNYPGGPQVDWLAAEGEDDSFPRVWLDKDSYDFSFKGSKSAVINQLHNQRQKNIPIIEANVATSFQNSVVEVLTFKAIQACKEYSVQRLIVAGGVAKQQRITSIFSGSMQSQ
ncbi:tRNA (adenosine(37)-N6)-threonylcarbamoyltransferase complex transferase subunit TsaD [Staphylococcus aureus]